MKGIPTLIRYTDTIDCARSAQEVGEVEGRGEAESDLPQQFGKK